MEAEKTEAVVGVITINLFQNWAGSGPWLHVWNGVDMAKYKPATARKPGDTSARASGIPISPEDSKATILAVQIERALRDKFVRRATKNYPAAVEWVRATVAEMDSPIEIAIFDRGLEH